MMTNRELRAILAGILGANDAGTCTRREWAGITVHDVDALLSEIDKPASETQNEKAGVDSAKAEGAAAQSRSLPSAPALFPASPGEWPTLGQAMDAFDGARGYQIDYAASMRSYPKQRAAVQAVLDLCRSRTSAQPAVSVSEEFVKAADALRQHVDERTLRMNPVTRDGQRDFALTSMYVDGISEYLSAFDSARRAVTEAKPIDVEELARRLRNAWSPICVPPPSSMPKWERTDQKSRDAWMAVARLAIELCAGREPRE